MSFDWNSNRDRAINKEETSAPIIGPWFDTSQEQGMDALKQNQALYGGLQTPQFEKWTPTQYQSAGDYNPEQAQASLIKEDPNVRAQQLSALDRMSGLSVNGLSDVDNANFEKARLGGMSVAQSGNASALQNAQARGVQGGGMEFAMREMANQAGADQARSSGLDQASESARQKALYNQAYGQGLSNLRSQDYGANSANANILNNFNQYNTTAANQGQLRNLQNKQDISNQNTGMANYAPMYNNQMGQQSYQDQLNKTQGQAGANTGVAQGYGAENAANTQAQNNKMGMLQKLFMM